MLAAATGAVSLLTALLLVACVVVIPMALTARRMLAMRYMQLCWKKCYTDKRSFTFGTLTRAEESINRAAHYGSLHEHLLVDHPIWSIFFFRSP